MNDPLRHRLYVDQVLDPGSSEHPPEIVLDRDQSHYLANVLRLGTGDRLLAFNDRDGEYEVEIAATAKKSVSLDVVRQTRPSEALPTLILMFAPVKRVRIDLIAEKATELGVGEIQPVMTEYTSVTRVNTDRMDAIAIEAAEQTGRLTVPDIRPPVPFKRMFEGWPELRHLVFCDEGLSGTGECNMADRVAGLSGPAAILVGPEGGFSQAERETLNAIGNAVPVSLGPNVLRADTAVVAALSIWQATAGDWRDQDGA